MWAVYVSFQGGIFAEKRKKSISALTLSARGLGDSLEAKW